MIKRTMNKFAFSFSLMLLCYSVTCFSVGAQLVSSSIKEKSFQNVVLEASLKPFKKNDKAYMQEVAKEIFTQWQPLLRHADTVSVMLWTSDGSEILDYRGTLDQSLEWARYMGNPNTDHEVGSGPEALSLHERAYLYMDNPPDFTYADLKDIVHLLKEVGASILNKPILVGATFDPGPEFAKSAFKYKKHPEILGGNAMGHKSFVSCYAVLNADQDTYAGYPQGIPQGTPFGTFFGKQCQHFLSDLGFDYIWFSNGFGFGAEGWSSTGSTFTGKGFKQERLAGLSAEVLAFWKLFRQECPDFPIQTRGTNLSVGADLARDAVDLRAIYQGEFNMLAPPNSPWAALDGDFGLELVGYMSRMAELPDTRFPFRYYTHDPWWLNSPWLDRYGREPHDIYLPMSVCRIDAGGNIGTPTQLNLLTIDDSYGNMPEQVPNEVIPHLLKARDDQPTAPGPLVWVYPFDEYHDWAYQYPDRLPEIYYGDWFIRQGINNGLPLNTVISTTAFQSAIQTKPDLFRESILITIAPDQDSKLEKALIRFVEQGGKLIIYGPVDHSSDRFRSFLNLANEQPLEGDFELIGADLLDRLKKLYPTLVRHQSLFSGGGLSTRLKDAKDPYTKGMLQMKQGNLVRDVSWTRSKAAWHGGQVAYIRGTNASSFTGGKLLTPDDPGKFFPFPAYLRNVLAAFGDYIGFDKAGPATPSPVLTISRSNNAFLFSGYQPNTTVKNRFKMRQGAPLLLGLDTELEEGFSTYNLPTAWNRACRVFIEQEEGIVFYKELHSGQKNISKRYEVRGLQQAKVRLYPARGIRKEQLHVYLNAQYPWKTGEIAVQEDGDGFVVENVTGNLVFAW